jgi:hypothetical protein
LTVLHPSYLMVRLCADFGPDALKPAVVLTAVKDAARR